LIVPNELPDTHALNCEARTPPRPAHLYSPCCL